MELTGIAGKIMDYAVLITAYTAFALGLFMIWHWIIFDLMLRRIFKWFNGYEAIIAFAWDYFKRKAKRKEEKEAKNLK